MLHKRLNTGLITDYKSIAQDGVSVYEKAISFRDSLYKAPEVGSKYVKYLAKPQYDAQNKTIDWYTPSEAKNGGDDYSIIKWSAATDKEREQALIKIKDLERTLRAYGKRLLNRGASGDNLVLAHFLTGSQDGQILPAIHFPNADCVYIVDGEPVITFWGFVETGDDMLKLPSSKLEKAVAPFVPNKNMPHTHNLKVDGQKNDATFTKVNETVTTNTVQEKNTHKCFFNFASICPKHHCTLSWPHILGALLGLFLLALLLWLLFKFLPLPSFGGLFNKGASDMSLPAMGARDDGLESTNLDLKDPNTGKDIDIYDKDQVISKQDDNDKVIDDVALDSQVEKDNVTVHKDLEPLDIQDTQNVRDIDKATVFKDDVNVVSDNDITNTKDTVLQDTVVDDEPKRAIDIATQKNENDTQIIDNNHDLNVSTVQDNFKNEPLVLDQTVIDSGNINALNGTWHTKSGLMDKYSGKPLNLHYEQQGNKSALTITRQDGVKCSARTNSSLDTNGLLINPNEKAICKDGSSYKMPAIKCKLLDDGKTLCEGQYDGQKPFKIRIFK